MQYLPTAFANVAFAWKLLAYGENGGIELQELDIDIVFEDDNGRPFFVPPSRIFQSEDELIIALQNNLTIAFGAAAITLNRSIEEAGHCIPGGAIVSENEQCVALVYQVRNAFAHDISQPRWELRNEKFRREYEINGKSFDLRGLHQQPFEYGDFSVEALFHLMDYATQHLFE